MSVVRASKMAREFMWLYTNVYFQQAKVKPQSEEINVLSQRVLTLLCNEGCTRVDISKKTTDWKSDLLLRFAGSIEIAQRCQPWINRKYFWYTSTVSTVPKNAMLCSTFNSITRITPFPLKFSRVLMLLCKKEAQYCNWYPVVYKNSKWAIYLV